MSMRYGGAILNSGHKTACGAVVAYSDTQGSTARADQRQSEYVPSDLA